MGHNLVVVAVHHKEVVTQVVVDIDFVPWVVVVLELHYLKVLWY